MKQLILILGLILLVGIASAVDLNEGITSSQISEVNLTKGIVEFTDVSSGISISTETIIDGEKFIPVKTKTDGESLTWSTGETDWFVFDDPNVALTYDYNGTFLKETIVLKEDRELSFPLKIDSNSRMVPYNGGFRIVPNEPLSTDKNGGYPPGIVIAAPFGYDSVGHYVPMEYVYDGESLSLDYDRTVKVYNETLSNEIGEYDEFGLVPKYDDVSITYPLTIDPTYYLSGYSSYNVLLLHMNQTVGNPTYFYDSSPLNKTIGVFGTAYTDIITKYIGNASARLNVNGSAYLSIPYSSESVFGTNNWTIKYKIRSDNWTPSSQTGIFVNGNSSASSGYASLYVSHMPSSLGVLYSTSSGGWSNIPTYSIPTTFVNGTWYDIAISRNGTKIYAYIDGNEARNWTTSSALYLHGQSTYIGKYIPSDPRYADANIDELAIWNGIAIPISELYPQTTEIETAIAPVATFTANVTSGYQPLAVQFTETSTSTGTSWQWNATALSNSTTFTFSTLQNPIQLFDTGNFSIKLKSTNGGGSNISTQLTWINVSSVAPTPPTASFTTNVTSGAIPLSVLFTDTSTGPGTLSYFWDFGDITNTTTRNATHTYSSAGIYTVNHSVSNLNGTAYATPVNITATTTASGFNRVDLEMEESYVLTVTFRDSLTGAPIPVVTVIDSNGYSQTTSTGVFTYNYPYGVVALYISSSGYNGKAVSYYIDSDRSETVQLTASTAASIQQQVYPQYVTFHLKEGWGSPTSDVLVEIQGSGTSTGDWDWIVSLLGLPLGDAPVNINAMNQTTDSMGRATFYIVPTAKYNVSFTKSGYVIPSMELVPQDKDYIIWAYKNSTTEGTFYEHGVNELEVVNISVTSMRFNDSYAYLNLTYFDSSGHTSGGYIDVLQKSDSPWAAHTLVARWPVTGNAFQNSTGISHVIQVSGYISANITHADFGQVVRSYPYSFNSIPVQFLGFGQDISLVVALGMIMLTLMLAGATHSRQVVFVAFVESWIFYTMHWFQSLIDRGVPEASIILALIIGTVMAAAAAFEVRKKKEKY